MRLRLVVVLTAVCSFTICQAIPVKFKLSIGGNAPDAGYSAIQTFDKGYLAIGSTSSYTKGLSDVYIVKTDSLGSLLWAKHYGGANIYAGYAVQETNDSSLIIAGYTNNTSGNNYEILLLKLDRWGDSLWSKTYGGSGWNFGYSVRQTFDGGYIIAGGTYCYGAGGEDFWMIKTDLNGDTLWTKTYGGSLNDEAHSVRQTSDSGYILIGTSKSFGDSSGNVYVVKTNALGDTLWTKNYGGPKEADGTDIIECKNGDFAFCGRTYSYPPIGYSKMFMDRLSKNDSLLWTTINTLYLPDSSYSSFESIVETKSGNIAASGITKGKGGAQYDGELIIVNANGNYFGGSTFGTAQNSGFSSLAATLDNGYILCGYTDSTSSGPGESNLFLVKTDSSGNSVTSPFLLSTKTIQNSILNSVSAYPNPFSSDLNIILNTSAELNPSEFRFSIRDISGRSCNADCSISSISTHSLEIKLNRGNLQQGIYFIQYYLGQQTIGVSKVVIE